MSGWIKISAWPMIDKARYNPHLMQVKYRLKCFEDRTKGQERKDFISA